MGLCLNHPQRRRLVFSCDFVGLYDFDDKPVTRFGQPLSPDLSGVNVCNLLIIASRALRLLEFTRVVMSELALAQTNRDAHKHHSCLFSCIIFTDHIELGRGAHVWCIVFVSRMSAVA